MGQYFKQTYTKTFYKLARLRINVIHLSVDNAIYNLKNVFLMKNLEFLICLLGLINVLVAGALILKFIVSYEQAEVLKN